MKMLTYPRDHRCSHAWSFTSDPRERDGRSTDRRRRSALAHLNSHQPSPGLRVLVCLFHFPFHLLPTPSPNSTCHPQTPRSAPHLLRLWLSYRPLPSPTVWSSHPPSPLTHTHTNPSAVTGREDRIPTHSLEGFWDAFSECPVGLGPPMVVSSYIIKD